MGFETGLQRNYFNQEWIIVPKQSYISHGSYYMNFITPFDSTLTSIPNKFLQRCKNMMKCRSSRTYKYDAVASIAEQLEEFQLKDYNHFEDDELSQNMTYMSLTRKLYQMSSSSLRARFDDGTSLKIRGIAFQAYVNSQSSEQEFLMSADSLMSGVSLFDNMQRYKMDSIYGKGTLKLLEEIGWPTRKNPATIVLQSYQPFYEFISSLGDDYQRGW